MACQLDQQHLGIIYRLPHRPPLARSSPSHLAEGEIAIVIESIYDIVRHASKMHELPLTTQLAGVATYGRRSTSCNESITRRISLWNTENTLDNDEYLSIILNESNWNE